MPGQIKQSFDYYLHHVHGDNYQKLLQLRIIHGLAGVGFYYAVLDQMFSSGSYKLQSDLEPNDTRLMRGIAARCGLTIKRFNRYFVYALEIDLFCKVRWESSRIITSDHIKNIYDRMSKRRVQNNGYKSEITEAIEDNQKGIDELEISKITETKYLQAISTDLKAWGINHKVLSDLICFTSPEIIKRAHSDTINKIARGVVRDKVAMFLHLVNVYKNPHKYPDDI